jgi:alkylation response protein AidB-like acyl-CoA dehydrogenase
MDFRPTEAQILIADTMASLVEDHLQRTRPGIDGIECADGLWLQLAGMGLLAAELDEAHGGSGGSFEELAIVLQGLGRAGGAGAFVPVVVMATALIARFGDDSQKASLSAIASGQGRVVPAGFGSFGNVGAEEDALTAVPSEGGWHLTGRIARVPAGDAADAFIVLASTAAGPTLFQVPADAHGLNVRRVNLYDGTGAADLRLDGCTVPAQARLGDEGNARSVIDWAIDRAHAAFANEAIGLMQALCDLTLDHIKTRKQFGQTLGSFQVVQHRMVDMRIELELARSMAILATVAADDPDERRRARDVSAARAAIGKASRIVGQSAIQLHGAIALTRDYPAGAYVKRLTLIERMFGDTDWHVARFARLA